MKSLLSSVVPKNRHSGLLIWVVLILIMLSGVMYLGFKVNEMHALSTSSKATKQPILSQPNSAVNASELLLKTLQAQPLVGQYIYKTKIILLDTSTTAPNRDALWQQGQKQLTLVQATVHVAVDLRELTQQSLVETNQAMIVLPPARILTVQVNNLTTFDTTTGLPSTVQLGLSMTSEQSKDIELQIEHDLCASGIMQTAKENARQRVVGLLELAHVSRTVATTDSVLCVKSVS